MRHLEVRFLWVQDALAKQRFRIKKIGGKENPADALTKPLGHRVLQDLLSPYGLTFASPLEPKGSG